MDSYTKCRILEARAKPYHKMAVEKSLGATAIEITDKYRQLHDGDWECRGLNIETKVEEVNKYKNLFIETISNANMTPPRPGWFYNCDRCHRLQYCFLDECEKTDCPVVYILEDMRSFRKWFETNKNRFEEKKQRKNDQENETWGRPIPIRVLSRECGLKTLFLAEKDPSPRAAQPETWAYPHTNTNMLW